MHSAYTVEAPAKICTISYFPIGVKEVYYWCGPIIYNIYSQSGIESDLARTAYVLRAVYEL